MMYNIIFNFLQLGLIDFYTNEFVSSISPIKIEIPNNEKHITKEIASTQLKETIEKINNLGNVISEIKGFQRINPLNSEETPDPSIKKNPLLKKQENYDRYGLRACLSSGKNIRKRNEFSFETTQSAVYKQKNWIGKIL